MAVKVEEVAGKIFLSSFPASLLEKRVLWESSMTDLKDECEFLRTRMGFVADSGRPWNCCWLELAIMYPRGEVSLYGELM